MATLLRPKTIDDRIVTIRGRSVLLDVDLAGILNLSPRELRELVAEHHDKFPGELCFQPEGYELPPECVRREVDVFTEPGAWMATLLLGARTALPRAIEISRAFDRYRSRVAHARHNFARR